MAHRFSRDKDVSLAKHGTARPSINWTPEEKKAAQLGHDPTRRPSLAWPGRVGYLPVSHVPGAGVGSYRKPGLHKPARGGGGSDTSFSPGESFAKGIRTQGPPEGIEILPRHATGGICTWEDSNLEFKFKPNADLTPATKPNLKQRKPQKTKIWAPQPTIVPHRTGIRGLSLGGRAFVILGLRNIVSAVHQKSGTRWKGRKNLEKGGVGHLPGVTNKPAGSQKHPAKETQKKA